MWQPMSVSRIETVNKEGQKRYTTEIKALTLTMLDSRAGSGGGMQQDSGNNKAGSTVDIDDSFDDMDDDLPF